jgi:hypothetical protein
MKKYDDNEFSQYDDSVWWECEYFEEEGEVEETHTKNGTTTTIDHANEVTPLKPSSV